MEKGEKVRKYEFERVGLLGTLKLKDSPEVAKLSERDKSILVSDELERRAHMSRWNRLPTGC